jgi:predicted nucleotidyltransferase
VPKSSFLSILRTLADHRVDFIVVGGVAAVLRGAPVNTFDTDVVHATEVRNVNRLLEAVQELDGFYRIQPERRLRPDASHLATPGHQMLMTRFGPLDLLGSISNGRQFSDLLPHSSELALGGISVRVLDLETLIAVKEETGGEKDLATLPILRRTLAESRRE